jgi:hypothetical protein
MEDFLNSGITGLIWDLGAKVLRSKKHDKSKKHVRLLTEYKLGIGHAKKSDFIQESKKIPGGVPFFVVLRPVILRVRIFVNISNLPAAGRG